MNPMSHKSWNKKVKSLNGNIKNGIKIVHWNLGSRYWDKKVNDIQLLVDEMNPEIAIISEANLFSGLQSHHRQIDGYNIQVTKDLENLGYSRLVILVREGFHIEIQKTWMEAELSTIWLKIKRRGCRSLTLGAVYREHRLLLQGYPNLTGEEACQNSRWSRILRQWTRASRDGDCAVIGDINLDQLTWRNPVQAHQIMITETMDKIETKNFTQIIEGPTRAWPGAADSLIDHCWVNCLERVISKRNLVRAAGDHNTLEIIIRMKGENCKSQNIVKRNWKKMIPERMKASVASIQWEQLYRIEQLDLANSWFTDKITQILDQEAPWVTIQARRRFRNWITAETKDFMDQRDKMREMARGSKTAEHWSRYKALRNICTARTKSDRTNFYTNKYLELEKNMDIKGAYSLMKDQAGWKKGGPPSQFIVEGNTINSPQLLANAQMEFFQQKLKKIKDKLPLNTSDPLEIIENALEKWQGTASRKVFDITETTELEVLKALKDLGSSSSCGMDGLDAITLKFLAPLVYKPLTYIVNLSLKQEIREKIEDC